MAAHHRRVLGMLILSCTLVAGCAEQRSDVVATEDKPSASNAAVVTEIPSTPVVVGSMGGALRLSPNLGAIYSIDFRDGGAWLNGVAVLRGSQRGWFDTGSDTLPLSMQHPGIGGSLGPHRVVVAPEGDAIWVNDAERFELGEGNVVLFDGAGERLIYVGERQLDSYLGPAPIQDAKQRKTLVQNRLAGLLTRNDGIAGEWPDPT